MQSSRPNIRQTTLRAALDYAGRGWPVVPGAVWRKGHFADPTDGEPVLSPHLQPLAEATTVLLSDHASVGATGMPLPLPPSSIGGTEVFWLITPEEAGDTLVAGDDLADLIHHLERKTA